MQLLLPTDMKRAGTHVIYAIGALLIPAFCFAQSPPTIYTDVDKLIRSGEEVKALGSDLFGEKINMYNGSVEFIQTDVSLPGNNALPVSVARKFTPGNQNGPQGLFGGWELEIPHLHGIFAIRGTSGTPPAPAGCGDFPAPAGRSYQGGSYNADEFWYGSFVSIPGLGDEEMLGYPSTNLSPTDGNSWPLITRSLWAIRCLSNGGFVVATPDGNQYQFDRPVSRPYPSLEKSQPLAERATRSADSRNDRDTQPAGIGPITNTANGYLLPREEKWILPSQVTDRFGNTVSYTYDAAHPWRLLSIVASDGRRLDLTYSNGSDTVSTVADGQRTWIYSYALYTPGGYSTPFNYLVQIIQPDNSKWNFSMNPLTPGSQLYASSAECDNTGYTGSDLDVGTMTHPSGATGSFSIRTVAHPRSFVPRACRGGDAGDPSSQWAYYPKYISNKALVSKTISGPGVPAESWAYVYSPIDGASWSDCSGSCPDLLTTEVTDPRGVLTRSTFGTRFRVSEGQLQKVEVISAGNTYRTTTMTYRAPDAGPYAAAIGQSFQQRGNGDLASRFTPQDRKVINQQAVDFTWQADGNSFDNMARPTTVTRSSSLGSRTEQTTFHDNKSKWILGRIDNVTVTAPASAAGKVPLWNIYDGTTDNLNGIVHFNKLDKWFGYAADGTVVNVGDGNNSYTVYSNYKRGTPQNIRYMDGATESATVNDIGNITSATDPNGFTSTFAYDLMGRLSQVNYPSNDSVAWNPTTISLNLITTAEVGIEPGHWRQTVTTGSATTYTVFDALLRPRYTETLDMPNLATDKTVVRHFDSANRPTFVSYPKVQPASIFSTLPGTTTIYDALGRVKLVQVDSEHGTLSTTTRYDDGFGKSVFDQNGYESHVWGYQAFDEPSESAITGMWTPEGAQTVINRDVFGKPSSITRSGNYQGTDPSFDPAQGVSVTRSYVYDPFGEVLCKTVEPEIGATIEHHDLAGNLDWRSTGLSQIGLTSCDYSAAPAAKKISYSYDGRNRLVNTSHGDGQPTMHRTYWLDGLLQTLSFGNATQSYEYNKRRLPTYEQLSRAGGPTAGIQTGYNANGHVQSHTYPDGAVVAYSPNALGEPTQVGSYANGISYFPNGALSGYTLGNGVEHSSTQNARGLPWVVSDSGVYQDRYDYDQNGNVSTITDLQQGVTTKSMTYDGLNRLVSSNSPGQWGNATYTYDPLDNIRRSVVGSRDATHHYTDNKLQYISIAGQPSIDYGYDVQSNVNFRNGQWFLFDIGNRMLFASGLETYEYDGFGRRDYMLATNGRTKFQMYDRAGRLMYGIEQAPGYSAATVRYIYLGDRLIAETYGNGTADTSTSYVHTDGLGSPVARTSSSSVAPGPYTRYEPYGNSTVAGPTPSPIGFTGQVNDVDTGLTYMQQRYYDPIAGRFLSADPVATDAETGGSFGRYHYANNNPFRFTDPDGQDPWYNETKPSPPLPKIDPSLCQFSTGTDCGRGADRSRNTAFVEARQAAGVPASEIATVTEEHLYDGNRAKPQYLYDKDGKPVMGRVYTYEFNGKVVVIQEHSAGHMQQDANGRWNMVESGHFNARDGAGKTLPGASPHYEFRARIDPFKYMWRRGGGMIPRGGRAPD